MKRIVCLLILALFLLAGCHTESSVSTEPTALATEPPSVPSVTDVAPFMIPDFSYEELQYETFYFSSGAGSWYTKLKIQSDGSFTGEYYNHDNIADSAYPEGTVYLCNFSGRFSPLEPVDAHTFSARLLELHYDSPGNTEEIRNRQRFVFTDEAVGLEDGTDFHFYLPGAPFAQLPEGYRNWVSIPDGETELPCYGLYNLSAENGLRSVNLMDDIRDAVSQAEMDEAYWEETANDPYATQADINIAAQYRYEVWDNVLNKLWCVLKQVLNEEDMNALTTKQLQWIAEKEQAMANAGTQMQGGSLSPTAVYGTGASLTKERVYELLELLP